jgi:hypothetical protein
MVKTTFDLIGSLKRIRQAVPVNFYHRPVLFLEECGEAFKRLIDPVFPEVFVYEGQEKGSSMPIAMAYAGTHTQVEDYWVRSALSDGWRKHSLGRQFYLNIPSVLNRTFPDCSLLLTEHNAMTKPKSGFLVPEGIDMEINISAPIEKLLGSQRTDILRRIRKFELTYEITKDPRRFNEFYYKMYLPYMKQRNSDPAAVATYSVLAEVFARGELILVRDSSAVLCGGLIEIQNGRVRCHKMGVKDGNMEYVREGVIGACYYFMVSEMKKRGFKKVHLGEMRPLLNDGITKFKVSLKAELAVTQHHAFVSLALLRYSPGIESFLISNPFICFDEREGAYRAVIFQPEDRPNEEFNDRVLDTICHGLIDTHIFIFGDVAERSNYFFCVKPAYPVFNHCMPAVKQKPQKVSWVKKALEKVSIAGG